MIPFSPPRIDQQTIDAVTEVLRSGWITTGPRTKEFERQLAGYIGVPKVIALNSWTNACELALRWFGVGDGDEVIVPAYTYCASANIVRHVGATPVIVDVLEDFTIDPAAVAAAITERTKCIIPVDIGGLPAHIDELLSILQSSAGRFNPATDIQTLLGRPLLLSDAAHSFGATYKGAVVGQQADITGYSFHAVKNLTTAEGGALAFSSHLPIDHDAVYSWFNTMSLHGQTKDALAKSKAGAWRYDVVEPGFKCNMTDLQAAIGLVELARYNSEMLPRRKDICKRYSDGLSAHEWAEIPSFKDDLRESSYHLYMLRVKGASEADRDDIIQRMAEKGVSANVHFQPLPMLTAYADHQTSSVPKAMELYANEISLPVYYDLTDAQVLTVIDALVASVHEVIGQ
jgi:dTDP-4-amino-4,6-dideoxygalactose transaminase